MWYTAIRWNLPFSDAETENLYMLSRLKAILADFFQQADLVLLSLCCISTLFGMVLIFSATRYLESNKYVIVQGVAMVLGICMYILFSMVDLEVLL